jgi:hypothetical protein
MIRKEMASHPDEMPFQKSHYSRKLLQKPDIIFKKQPDILNPVLQDRDPLNAHAKSKTSIFFAVDATVFQDPGIHHATTENFHPA